MKWNLTLSSPCNQTNFLVKLKIIGIRMSGDFDGRFVAKQKIDFRFSRWMGDFNVALHLNGPEAFPEGLDFEAETQN